MVHKTLYQRLVLLIREKRYLEMCAEKDAESDGAFGALLNLNREIAKLEGD